MTTLIYEPSADETPALVDTASALTLLGSPGCCCGDEGAGGCNTFLVTVIDEATGDGFPGLTVDIYGLAGTGAAPVSTGTTDGDGAYAWSGSHGTIARVTSPDDGAAVVSAEMQFVPEGDVCIASFRICKFLSRIVVENGGTLANGPCFGECSEPGGKYEKSGNTYVWTDYGIRAGDDPTPMVGPTRCFEACTNDEMWGGCACVTGICGGEGETLIHTWLKSEWNHSVQPACTNDRQMATPKQLCVTYTEGPDTVFGGNIGTPLLLDWDPTSWDGDPCTYGLDNTNATRAMVYKACIDPAGAYGTCGAASFRVDQQTKVPYGGAIVTLALTRFGTGNSGASISYTPRFDPTCVEPDVIPRCGPGNAYAAGPALVCPRSFLNPDGSTFSDYYTDRMPANVGFYHLWSGGSTGGHTNVNLGGGVIDLQGASEGNDSTGTLEGQGYIGPDSTHCGLRAPGLGNYVHCSVSISEPPCGDNNPYGYMTASREITPQSADEGEGFRPATIAPSDPRVRVGLLAPSCNIGGAETWQQQLARTLDPARFAWTGLVIVGGAIDPAVAAGYDGIMPVGKGRDAASRLAAASDVIVSWAIEDIPGLLASIPGRSRPKVVSVVHAPVESEWGQHFYGKPEGIDRWVAVSELALAAIPEASLAGRPASVIWNAVDAERLKAQRSRSDVRASWGVPEGVPVAGFLQRFTSEKDPLAAARLATRLPEPWRVVIVGDGPMLQELERLKSEGELDRLVIAGADRGAGDVLTAFDCLVVPSLYESFGLSIGEGLWLGVPVISTAVGIAGLVPGLTRAIPMLASGDELAGAVLADWGDVGGTVARVDLGRAFAGSRLGAGRFGREWGDLLGGLVPRRSVAASADGGVPCKPCGKAKGPLRTERPSTRG